MNIKLVSMIRQYNNCIFLFFCLCLSFIGQGQNSNSPSIYLDARAHGDSICLRWAPSALDGLIHGGKVGYIIERKEKETGAFKAIKVLTAIYPDKSSTNNIDSLYELAYNLTFHPEEFNLEDPNAQDNLLDKLSLKRKNENQRFGFALFALETSYPAAKKFHIGYTDRDVKPGVNYEYRVSFKLPSNKKYLPGIFSVKNVFIPLVQPPKPLYQFGDKNVNLAWNAKALQDVFVYYDIYRSDDKGLTFGKENRLPILFNPASNRDSILLSNRQFDENQKTIVYKYQGVNRFGERSTFSDTISGMGMPKIIATPIRVTETTIFGETSVGVTWQFDKSFEKDIKGFRLYRAKTPDSEKELVVDTLIAPSYRQYIDLKAPATTYYYVGFVDQFDRERISFPMLSQMEDITPPAPPTGLEVTKFDSITGDVYLRWNANTEPDFKHYRVYMGNREEGYFALITDSILMTNSFQYNLDVEFPVEKIYFKVLASDNRNNYSDYSDIVYVKKKDLWAPAAPFLAYASPNGKYVEIEYGMSPSEDILKHDILRKVSNNRNYQLIGSDSTHITDRNIVFRDTLFEPGTTYTYQIKAIDDDGLTSRSEPFTVSIPYDIQSDTLEIISARHEDKCSCIKVNFKYNSFNSLDKIIAYGSKDSVNFRSIQRVKKSKIDNLQDVFGMEIEDKFKWYKALKFRIRNREGLEGPISTAYTVE